MNKRGSVSVFVGATVPIALVAGVFAIDASRIWLAQRRLQAALDAAVLTAARDMGTTAAEEAQRDRNALAVLAANWGGGAPPRPGEAAAPWQNAAVKELGDSQIQVSAEVTVKPLLGTLSIAGYTVPGTSNTTIARSAVADRTSTGIELALVFDVTGSMGASDGTNSGKSRIVSARDAALEMMKILYKDTPTTTTANRRNWMPNLYVSVVPFNIAVNFGSANTHMLDAPPADADYANPNQANSNRTYRWGGCVEVRDRELLDANPRDAGAGLRRYFWPSTYDPAAKYDSSKENYNYAQPHCRSEAAYTDTRTSPRANPSGAHRVCMGHNDWTAPDYVFDQRQNTFIKDLRQNRSDAWTIGHGPNLQCPTTQAILPLTRDRNVIEAKINAMASLPYSSGTAIASGLQAAWFTLSPKWRARSDWTGWPSAEPSPPPTDGRPATVPALPLDYYTPNMRKVIVLLSDGDNNWLSSRSAMGHIAELVRPESRRVEFYYNAYGYLGRDFTGDDRLDVTINTGYTPGSTSLHNDSVVLHRNRAETKMDEEVIALCKEIRAKTQDSREQITIYAIGLGVAEDAHRQLMEACVSEPNKVHYIHANTNDNLRAAFAQIAQELSNLRLSQ